MKKLFSILLLVFVTLAVQAQIHQPVKWKIKLEDSKTAEKEIVFTATIEKGWHLYDMNLPEGGPVSTSFTFETLQGAELIGQPVPTSSRPSFTTNSLPWTSVGSRCRNLYTKGKNTRPEEV